MASSTGRIHLVFNLKYPLFLVRKYFICHFCFDEFPNRSSLVSHFSQCHMKNATKRNDATNSLPRLNKNDRDILQSKF